MRQWFKRLAYGCLLTSFLASAAHAQWLNYKTPGVPRAAHGSPRLDAPAPKFFDGRPDRTGVWMHDFTPVEEMKRLFGEEMINGELKTEVPGMEFGNVHKYALDVLIDFPPDQSPARPEANKASEERMKNPPASDLCYESTAPAGFPLVGLLSEPIKIVQAPHQTLVLC